ncbi:DUF3322 domain-containing protein [Telluria aromaticivorans]|uniref:Wadjet protein JetD C-terminal domain-containing protein n=1 Tax=Telluria aromaticivorans TaxID=2725995 RepID=A0A7Y2K5J2_9BURK|nr:DUF3322 domain-containing protein [Telluria aromaticivorans]NNG25864.1 hypothetical protein [Telluria aromaticivorans]
MRGVRTARWTTPEDIVASTRQLWDSGALLRARFEGAALFPYELRLRQPGVADMGEQFEAVRAWIGALAVGDRERRGYGYDLVWRAVNHRQLGRNNIPVAAVIPSVEDALRMIGRAADARLFDRLAGATLEAFPALRAWLGSQPLKLLDHADAWERVLAVLHWFVAHPLPGIYLRQLDIEGVDTKFIESRRGLLTELLDQVLPAGAMLANTSGVGQFETRFGLVSKPALIRFRMLDPGHFIGGLSDLTVPVAQFATLDTRVERVFVTENEVNALAFPPVRSGMVVFGGGYGIDRLAQTGWLHDRELLYWGDIDTHGFAILDRLRANLPHVRSLLMDAQTLHVHARLWGQEDPDKRYTGELGRLTDAEHQLFIELCDNIHGERLRMEQERVGYRWALAAIRNA